jgi:hypothetical protein
MQDEADDEAMSAVVDLMKARREMDAPRIFEDIAEVNIANHLSSRTSLFSSPRLMLAVSVNVLHVSERHRVPRSDQRGIGTRVFGWWRALPMGERDAYSYL